ncbi:hypothetical protein IQ13_0247 [Lacibacter cauensis]|uniref:Uncharacterized protein n=1 Tax=Lacibacter cauensis TaxID=510947 RepID=A0A562SV19_9BACT|nr:T-complex 10 C-terminal domain-containing protein [Lacibacter cauensis]TWI85092.1 hypothetical protein IQ13_0247 [Lacibacter cauensis]
MANLKFYKWSIALMMLVVSTSASAQLFPRNGNIFGNTSNRPVIRQDGSRQWPDGTIQYPDGTTRYPDGAVRYPNGTMSYPRNNRNYDNCNHRSNLPPGQAKKIYGGHARDYAKGRGKKGHDCDHDDRNWNDRNVRNYPNQYPQYPSYPQYPNNTPQNGGKRPSRTTNPNL